MIKNHRIFVLLFLFSCSSNSIIDSEKQVTQVDSLFIDSLARSRYDFITIENEYYNTKVAERIWSDKAQFLTELSKKNELIMGDEFHEYLHFNFNYHELLKLTSNESKCIRGYALCALRKYRADTLYNIARLVRNDTAQLVTIWRGRSDEHVNCYTITQIGAQSLIWYEIEGKISDGQLNEMKEQMESNLPPISKECGTMYSY